MDENHVRLVLCLSLKRGKFAYVGTNGRLRFRLGVQFLCCNAYFFPCLLDRHEHHDLTRPKILKDAVGIATCSKNNTTHIVEAIDGAKDIAYQSKCQLADFHHATRQLCPSTIIPLTVFQSAACLESTAFEGKRYGMAL